MSSLAEDYPFTAAVLDGRERWALVDEDCLEFLRKLPDCSIDAVVTDPPAAISFMGREWDAFESRDAFVGFLTERFVECRRVLKPGGHVLVWSLPRTSHWTGLAIEDAGFDVRDCVYHVFGQGFPKSLDIAKAIAKRAGGPARAREAIAYMQKRREELGISRIDLERRIFGRADGNVRNWEDGISIPVPGLWPKIRTALGLSVTPYDADMERGDCEVDRTEGNFGYQTDGERWRGEHVLREPATDLARQRDGLGTALKPAAECWWLARKPIEGTVADNVLRYGTGALNIDGCRVATNAKLTRKLGKTTTSPSGWTSANRSPVAGKDGGRWPANIVLSHASGCELNCTQECPVAEIDRQSGASQSRVGKPRGSKEPGDGWGMTKTGAEYDDRGGASRFFFVAKPSRKEREAGLDGLALAPKNAVYGDGLNSATKIRTEEQAENGVDRGGVKNNHPTVKSVTLMRYLCRLITPPNGIVLDPFTGSGSTGCGALLEGFRFIGIEREPAYCQIAVARITHWEQQADQAQTEELQRCQS